MIRLRSWAAGVVATALVWSIYVIIPSLVIFLALYGLSAFLKEIMR